MNLPNIAGILVFMLCIVTATCSTNGTFMNEEQWARKPGHVILGGLFPAHTSRQGECSELNMEGIALIEAMIYTINRVNRESLLPWNLTLGYDIRDTCDETTVALRKTLHFLSPQSLSDSDVDESHEDDHRRISTTGKLISVIGAGRTQLSVAVNKILSVFSIPQIGYASTSGILSDKSQFPSFSRTVVPGSHRPQLVIKLLAHFGWKYVALIVSDSLHWKSLSLEFKNLASPREICLGIDEIVPSNSSREGLLAVMQRLKANHKAQIVLLFTSPYDTNIILKEASLANLIDKVWIASESLSKQSIAEHAQVLSKGMFAFVNEPESAIWFSNYFAGLNPIKNKWNPWFHSLWKNVFGCLYIADEKREAGVNNSTTYRTCKGTENFSRIRNVLSFSHVTHVIDAVMSVCHVIKKICQQSNLNQKNMSAGAAREECLHKLTNTNVLSQMFKGPFVFSSLSNRSVSVDSNGDTISSFRIQNLQQDEDGAAKFRTIGTYGGPSEGTLDIDSDMVQWINGSAVHPVGMCSVPCKPGSYKVFRGSRCCWRCKKCKFGSIAKTRNAVRCTRCKGGFFSNTQRTSCKKMDMVYFSWGSPAAGTIMAISLICFVLSLLVFVVFLKYDDTQVVNGMGSENNFRLLSSIFLGVLVPFAFIGRPTDNMCKIQTVLFGTSLTLSVSLVLAKTKQVTCDRKHMTPKWRMQIYGHCQSILSLFLTFIELFICVFWIILSPPQAVEKKMNAKQSVLVCSNNNSAWSVLSFFYILGICIISTCLACKCRKRPVNYSETKFILYGMIAFYSVWVVFLAVFYGTPSGLGDVTILCLAIMASQMTLLGFIFVPKLFIIFFRPKLNKESVFQTMINAQIDIQVIECRASMQRMEYLQSNGQIAPRCSSFRDVSQSRAGTPSPTSLGSYTHPSPGKRLSQPSCFARLLPRHCSSMTSLDSQENINSRLGTNPLPVILIEDGPVKTTSAIEEDIEEGDRCVSYRCTCGDDNENQVEVNATHKAERDSSMVWTRRPRDDETSQRRKGRRESESEPHQEPADLAAEEFEFKSISMER